MGYLGIYVCISGDMNYVGVYRCCRVAWVMSGYIGIQ